MEQTIKGTINYEIKVTDDMVDIDYDSTIDNDLAAMLISQYVMENVCVGLRESKKQSKGKVQKAVAEKLNHAISGRYGLGTVIDYFLANYEEYKKDMEFLSKITVEQGTLSDEEATKMGLPKIRETKDEQNKED